MSVVVTGMGVTSALGCTVEKFWSQLREGVNAVSLIEKHDCTELPVKFAAEIKEFDFSQYLTDVKEARRLSEYIKFGYAAALNAIKDAGLENGDISPERIGCVVGSGMGGIDVFEENVLKGHNRGPRRVSPFFIPMAITNMMSGFIAMKHNFQGPNFSISTACASANHSIIEGAHIIERGEADVMLVGGSESAINFSGLSGFCAQKAVSFRNDDYKTASRPFDKNRDGFVMGEGAGVLVIESEEHARKRGATIYARYLGGGMSCDAYHMTAPPEDGRGAANAMKLAIKHAGLNPDAVGYVNGHATSTPRGDIAELTAIKTVFGDHRFKMKLNATKSLIGHTLGAAGAIEAIALIKSLDEQFLHPTLNIQELDEFCDMDVCQNEGKQHSFEIGMSNAFGFGGHNSSVLFGKWNG
jgi:3-oxoacyl-[acyl-carrier-protein] synthase II